MPCGEALFPSVPRETGRNNDLNLEKAFVSVVLYRKPCIDIASANPSLVFLAFVGIFHASHHWPKNVPRNA
jgi:hypothetical protein